MRAGMNVSVLLLFAVAPSILGVAHAEPIQGFSEAYPPALDPFTGNYEGESTEGDEKELWLAAQIVPLGKDLYRITLTNLLDVRCPKIHSVEVPAQGDTLEFKNDTLYGAVNAGQFEGGKTREKEDKFRLRKVERPSPNLGAPPPANATVLFDGTNLDAFRKTKGWVISPDRTLVVTPGAPDTFTAGKFTDVQLHLEFRLPYRPAKRGQDRGNSGVSLQNAYEVQILDSFGLEGTYDECAAVYKIAAPRVNVCRPPLQWQSYDITFHAPRFDGDGKLAQLGRITVYHNGALVHDDQELPWRTSGGRDKRDKPHPNGPEPIKFQEHGDFMEFRNIWLVDLQNNP